MPPSIDAALAHHDAAIAAIVECVGRALVARYGIEVGTEAAHDAALWACEHPVELAAMRNPTGYLFRVGQSASRKYRRRTIVFPPEQVDHSIEHTIPDRDLAVALQQLTHRQRSAVVLVHAHGYTLTEAAATLGCSVSSLRNHITRGTAKLRNALGTNDG